jgi:NAD(P)-dependent dehydrogenase (short-subunit alcohol dehydrogenase family)
MSLSQQTVVITGAGRGIGEAVAHAFAKAGANLLLVARTQCEVERVARETAARGVTSVPLASDVSKRCDVEKMLAVALEKLGGIDVLVNAAGIYGPIGSFVDSNLDHWTVAMQTNLMGTVFTMHAVLPHMLVRRKGAVINFSGGGAVQPLPRFSAYGTSKAAVVRLTETVAEEVKDTGVRINAIAPGAVNTRLLDEVLAAGESAGRSFYAKALEQKEKGGTPPERAAELAVFLASPAAQKITGRLISAVWDDWKSLPQHEGELEGSALFTLRRIDGRQFREAS